MPKPPPPPEFNEYLAQPDPSVIATLDADGGPHTAATWYLWENGRVLVNMDEGRKRLEDLRQEPRVSITVLGKDDSYHHVTIRGRVVSLEPDPNLSDIDRLSRHYIGQPCAQRDRGRVSACIDVDSWHAWAWVSPGPAGAEPGAPRPVANPHPARAEQIPRGGAVSHRATSSNSRSRSLHRSTIISARDERLMTDRSADAREPPTRTSGVGRPDRLTSQV